LENTTRKQLHSLELTSSVTTKFAYNRTSSHDMRNVIAELTL